MLLYEFTADNLTVFVARNLIYELKRFRYFIRRQIIQSEFYQRFLLDCTAQKLQEKKELFPGMLSGGQQQRAAIARALASKPAIILADEPTGNLDTESSHSVLGLLKMAAKRYQQTIVLITHDYDIAQLADRIVRIEDGRIVKGGSVYA